MNEIKNKKYLPVGSVVLLKKGRRKLVIIGYFSPESTKSVKVYEYIGCMYPDGFFQPNLLLGFNHEDIKEVYFVGYANDEYKVFNEKIKDFSNKYVDSKGNLKVSPEELVSGFKQ